MMSPEQVKTVTYVYHALIQNEERGWDGLDDCMDLLENLDDDQLYREVDVLLTKHLQGKPRCKIKHNEAECFIPRLIEAVSSIAELYKKTGYMHKNNRYILMSYLGLQEVGEILVDAQGQNP